MSFLGWQYSKHVVTRYWWEKLVSVHNFTGRGQLKAPSMEPSWTRPHASLSLADFNLYPFAVIKCNHEYNSFQWVNSVSPASELPNLGDPGTLQHPFIYLNCSPRGTDVHFLSPLLSGLWHLYRPPFFLQCSPAWVLKTLKSAGIPSISQSSFSVSISFPQSHLASFPCPSFCVFLLLVTCPHDN